MSGSLWGLVAVFLAGAAFAEALRRGWGLVAVFFIGAASTEAVEQGLVWKAGVGRNAITPAEPVWLSGYEDRTKPSEGVLRDLYVKALALDDGSGPAVLVTADILGYTRETGDRVAAQCLARFGLARDRLVLNASHTHTRQ